MEKYSRANTVTAVSVLREFCGVDQLHSYSKSTGPSLSRSLSYEGAGWGRQLPLPGTPAHHRAWVTQLLGF